MTFSRSVLLIFGAALFGLLTDAGTPLLVEARLLLRRGSWGSVGRSAAARAGKSGSDPLPHAALGLRAADRAGDERVGRRPPMPSLANGPAPRKPRSCGPRLPRSLELSPCDGLTFDIFEGD